MKRLLLTLLLLALTWCLGHFSLAEYYWHRGLDYYREKQYRRAIESFNSALGYGLPAYLGDPECLYCDRANAYDMDGQIQPALADYDEAIRRSPRTGRFYVEKAVAYRRNKQYQEAVASMDLALALPKPLPRHFVERADSLVALGEYNKALADLNEYLKNAAADQPAGNSRHYHAWDLHGWANYKLSKYQAADYALAQKAPADN